MDWKFWRWIWWRPPPSTPLTERNGTMVPDDQQAAQEALRRAREAQDAATRQGLELRDLRNRAARQREENHFGSDLYRVMRGRRGD